MKVYWDACTWISLINEEAGRVDRCKEVIRRAQNGEMEIWTSTLNLAEVYKKKCNGQPVGINDENSEGTDTYEDYWQNDFVQPVQLDEDVGIMARNLLRDTENPLKMPNDAIHLATAAWHNVDEFHTFDEDHILPLDGKITRRDGKSLRIKKPPHPIPLFDMMEENSPKDEDEKVNGQNVAGGDTTEKDENNEKPAEGSEGEVTGNGGPPLRVSGKETSEHDTQEKTSAPPPQAE